MVNGALQFVRRSLDLGGERGDALVQFLDRIGVEVLDGQLGDKIVLAPGKIFVCIHRDADR